MQLLMENVDMLQQDLYRLLGYEKNLAKQQQSKQQFIQRRVGNAGNVGNVGSAGNVCNAGNVGR